MDEHSGMLLCMSFQILSMFYKKDLLCVCVCVFSWTVGE